MLIRHLISDSPRPKENASKRESTAPQSAHLYPRQERFLTGS